ncbi:MAG: Positive regulator of sigma(E) RseC/MucC [Clostridia bacterium]|nr:Positive regulator of sigma(E) RseC/MucC [Clostridia bacterium]
MPNGIVQKLEGEYAIVEIKRQDMCGDCHACDTVHEAKECKLKCINTAGSKVGDTVEISLDNESFLKATYIMYGAPLLGLLGGVGGGFIIAQLIKLNNSELLMIIGALAGMVAAYTVINKRDKKNRYKKMLPHIINIINSTH